MLRTLAEKISRLIVIKRRLPKRFGRILFYATPDSALQYLKPNLGDACTNLLLIAEEFVNPGDCVWDIGANVGVFSFAAAHRCKSGGQVFAIEADPFLASLIQKSILLEANRDLSIHVICTAAADRLGIARFLIAQRGRSSNALETSGHQSQAGGTRYTQYVPTLTLDTLLETSQPPAFIKIDVEGAEVMVLRGATNVLSEHRPSLYCEVSNTNNMEVANILSKLDYVLYDGDSQNRQPREDCAFNTLAIPKEKIS